MINKSVFKNSLIILSILVLNMILYVHSPLGILAIAIAEICIFCFLKKIK